MLLRRFSGLLVALPTLIACNEGDLPDDSMSTGGTTSSGGASSTGGTTSSGGTSSGGGPTTPPFEYVLSVGDITTWRGDARAAYTIVHDDTCNPSVDKQFDLAAPALNERGLRATFGAIAQDCSRPGLWDRLEELRDAGHEICSHTWDHQNLPDVAESNLAEATGLIDQAKTALEANLDDYRVATFIFPYDAFNDSLVNHLRSSGHLGARAGDRGLNEASFSDPFRLRFDVYGPGYSVYIGADGTPCSGYSEGNDWDATSSECRFYVLNNYVDEVIAASGYGIRELHSVDGEAWEPVPILEYESHLDYVKTKVDSGDLWVDTMESVVRYRVARDACAAPTFANGTLTFAAPSTECQKYATELSFRLTAVGTPPPALAATQNGVALTVREEATGTYLIDANPVAGPVTLSSP